MKIKFIQPFSGERESYAGNHSYEVAEEHAQKLIKVGIAISDEPKPEVKPEKKAESK